MSSNYVIERLDVRRWSLTARLAVFFGAAIAVIVVGVSWMMYAELVHQLHEKEELELKNAMVIELEVLDSLARRQPTTRWQHEWDEQQEQTRLFAWQLRAAGGGVSAASVNTAGMPVGAAAIRTGMFVRVREAVPAQARTFLVLQIEAGTKQPAGSLLRGALDVSQDEKVLTRYRARLLGVVALSILLSAAIGYLLARSGLAPLRAMSADIGRVNAERLHARIAQEGWPSELRQLAMTFDDMMARIERSFEQLSRFSSDLAHEFRSPINNLVAAASVTLRGARDAAEYEKTLEVVVEQGNRLSRRSAACCFWRAPRTPSRRSASSRYRRRWNFAN